MLEHWLKISKKISMFLMVIAWHLFFVVHALHGRVTIFIKSSYDFKVLEKVDLSIRICLKLPLQSIEIFSLLQNAVRQILTVRYLLIGWINYLITIVILRKRL